MLVILANEFSKASNSVSLLSMTSLDGSLFGVATPGYTRESWGACRSLSIIRAFSSTGSGWKLCWEICNMLITSSTIVIVCSSSSPPSLLISISPQRNLVSIHPCGWEFDMNVISFFSWNYIMFSNPNETLKIVIIINCWVPFHHYKQMKTICVTCLYRFFLCLTWTLILFKVFFISS